MGEAQIVVELARLELEKGIEPVQAVKNGMIQFKIALEETLNYEYNEKKYHVDKCFKPKKDKKFKDEIREEVLNDNIGLVYKIAKERYSNTIYQGHFGDIVNEGFLGLMKAYEKYDVSKGAFSTYAYTWIWSYMDKYVKRFIERRKGNSLKHKPQPILSLNKQVKGEYESVETLEDIIVGETDITSEENCIVKDFLDYVKVDNPKYYKFVKDRLVNDKDFKDLGREYGITLQCANMRYIRIQTKFVKWYKEELRQCDIAI